MAEALTPRHCFPTFNYDRLETLGDAFLKYDCCTHVYFAYPKAHEGRLFCFLRVPFLTAKSAD